jgi:hypothetical protein
MIFSGRNFTQEEIDWINNQTSQTGIKRTKLSKLFCKEFGWLKPNGTPKDVSCRVAFLRMEAKGLIKLPAAALRKRHEYLCKTKTEHNSSQSLLFDINPAAITLAAGDLNINIELVTNKTTRLWNELINEHHYLGHKTLPGAQLRYIVRHKLEIIACLGFGASAWCCAPRDKFIGWSNDLRKKNLQLVINNARFLILPWVKSKNLATKILSLISKRIEQDWQDRYNYKPVLLETFVEKQRFLGTCYKAANWICVGDTQGRGKKDVKNEYNLPVKSIWLYPLDKKKFREVLCKG